MRKFYFLLAFLLPFVLAACGGQPRYSDDPIIAMKQKWVEACGQMGQSVASALSLGKLGHLTEAEAQVMDRVDIVYREVCTADPAPLTDILKSVAIKTAVGELCPELVVIGEDMTLTIAQAATCAARKALLLQLEETK